MDKIEELTIKNNDDEHKIIRIDSCDVTGIQRNKVEELIKKYCSANKEQIVDLIREVILSISPENGRMPEKRIFVPLIQQLAYNMDDDYLRETFQKLLKSSMSKDKNVHPSFVSILSQLNSDEIKILNKLPPVLANNIPLINIRMKHGANKGDGMTIVSNFTDIGYGVCEHPERVCFYIENLERLKLIQIPPFKTLIDKTVYRRLKEHPAILNTINETVNNIPGVSFEFDERLFSLTQFGLDFILSCK